MVGAGRFERPTPCAQDIRSPHLRINRFNNLQTLRVGPFGNFSYNLDGKPAIRLAKPPTKPTGSPAGSADCKINQRGRAPAVAAVGRSVVERLADPSYNRDFGQVPGHFPESPRAVSETLRQNKVGEDEAVRCRSVFDRAT